MRRVSILIGALAVTTALSVRAQNPLFHYDGSTEATSRPGSAAPATVLQRIPADQACGATAVAQFLVVIQDQDTITPEMYGFEVRTNDPAGSPTGSPDVTAAGLLGSAGPFTITFPGGPISAVIVTVTLTTPISLPATPTAAVPAGDFYVGARLDTPWNAAITDGISVHLSGTAFGNPGEQMNPVATGYTGITGQAGLGWGLIAGAAAAVVSGSNRSWVVLARLVDAVVQVAADNAAVFTGPAPMPNSAGVNPNFGYAGIWPDMNRVPGPDGVLVRVLATAPVGTPVLLLPGVALLPAPAPFPGFGGVLCQAPIVSLIGVFVAPTGPPTPSPISGPGVLPPATTSQALFGPFPGNAALTGAIIYLQALVITAPPAFSTMCTMYL